jgi:hypothetical protein
MPAKRRSDGAKRRREALPARAALFTVLCVSALACSDNRSTAEQRQDELLRNPFGYKTDDNMDVSGGRVHELDRDAFKKDVGNVLNP